MSFTPAKPIESSQEGLHEKLEEMVEKHLAHRFNRPISKHNEEAFIQAFDQWQIYGQPRVILDSACGTAESSRFLAQQFPEHLVIGIDQSEKRLNNSANRQLPENCLLLRCECIDFWQLAEKEHWHFDQHYLLYPNPWPKTQHLMRRWHAHPALSSLLSISKKIELRTNWDIYAKEFLLSMNVAKTYDAELIAYAPEQGITAFEKKYLQSKHPLWQVKVTV